MIVVADINSWCVDGRSNGHYVPVAQNLMDVLCPSASRVTVAGGPVFRQYFSPDDLMLLPFDVHPNEFAICRKLKNMANFLSLYRRLDKGDIVVFQASAITAVYLGLLLFGRKSIRHFFIQYSTTEGLSSWIKRLLWRLAKKRVSGVLCTNEDIGVKFGIASCVVPDYIAAHQPEGKPFEGFKYDFVFAGTITAKKGVVEGVESLAGKGFSVHVAGRSLDKKLTDKLKGLESECTNLSLKLGYLEPHDFDSAFRSAKMTVLNYTESYSQQSSGIVYDALFRFCPILGKRCRALKFIEDFGLGELYDDLSQVDAIQILAEDKQRKYRENIATYLEKHKEYADKLCAFVMRENA